MTSASQVAGYLMPNAIRTATRSQCAGAFSAADALAFLPGLQLLVRAASPFRLSHWRATDTGVLM